MPHHICLAGRKSLAARLGFIKAVLPQLVWSEVSGFSHQKTVLENSIRTFSDPSWVVQNSPDAEPLPTFLRRFLADRQQELKITLNDPDNVFLPILEGFRENIDRIADECASCGNGVICKGLPRDDMLVATKGYCIGLLKTVFDVAWTAAVRYYREYAHLGDPPQIMFSTASVREPHSLPTCSDIAVGGEAYNRTSTAGWEALVTLKINVDAFNAESYLACLYVLLHECVVHAFEGILHPAPPTDAFAEGWVDYAAEQMLEDIVLGVGLAADLGHKLLDLDGVFRAGNRFATARDAHPWPGFGNKAATNLMQLLEPIPRKPCSSRELFYRIALDANRQVVTDEVRQAFIRVLAYPHATPYPGITPSEITNRVVRYARGTLDARQLIEEIAELSRK